MELKLLYIIWGLGLFLNMETTMQYVGFWS